MNIFNRLTVFYKRIFSKKTYLIMLIVLIVLTVTYKLLPAQKKTADIKVAIYHQENSYYSDALYECFSDNNTLYNFYPVNSMEELTSEVKSGKAECGFYIPKDFYINYIKGIKDTPIIMYDTPSASLSSAICETLFSCILSICSPEILTVAVDATEHNDELISRMKGYIQGDEIFHIESLSDGSFSLEEETYHLDIPVYEIGITLITFSALLGLLIYLQDLEKGIYVSLESKALASIKCISIFTAISPMLFITMVCNIILSGTSAVLNILTVGLIVLVATLLLSLIIRKSTLLNKVLPLVMLICTVVIFVGGLI